MLPAVRAVRLLTGTVCFQLHRSSRMCYAWSNWQRPRLMQPQKRMQADLASSGPAIAVALRACGQLRCKTSAEDKIRADMRRLVSYQCMCLFDCACLLRVIDRQAPLAAAPRTLFSAPVPLEGVGITFNHRATCDRVFRAAWQLLGHCPSLH